ncbi:MAG TPA: cell division protein FtsA [Longimicrobiales bacterium]|nr:cell division protein FtsA [Longimicrobiales bacterium]
MTTRSNAVAGLDIGSTKTCAVIADISTDARGLPVVKVLGVGQARTGGMRREVVTDIEGTTESVRAAMKEAELMAGVSVDRVFTGVAGEYIHARTSNGVVAVGGEEIVTADVKRVQEVARAVVVPADREVLHALPQEYIVDHQRGIRDPIGMAGTRLEAEVYIITSSITATQNLRKAVSRAGYRIERTVHEPLATSLAVVADDEKDVGVALVDMGASTTELAIFREGKMRHLASIPWGGGTVTNDLAKGLSITYAEAEKAKERHGVAFAQLVDPRETVDLPGPGPGSTRQVARELIAHIIEQRLDEILGLVAREIENAGESGKLGAGAVLTGGGAGLTGAVDVAQHVFGMPTRVGIPGDGLVGLADSVRRPQFATATGLVLFGAGVAIEQGLGTGFGDGVAGRLMSWLKEFF